MIMARFIDEDKNIINGNHTRQRGCLLRGISMAEELLGKDSLIYMVLYLCRYRHNSTGFILRCHEQPSHIEK